MSVGRREFRPAVRRAVLSRAVHRCEACGARGSLEFHHVGSRGDRSAFNCQALCPGCHLKLHIIRKTRRQMEAAE